MNVPAYEDIDIAQVPAGDVLKRGKVYQKVDLHLPKDVNLVTYECLQPALLLKSADINAVAIVAEVRVEGAAVKDIRWHIGSDLVAFLLEDQTLRIVRTDNQAQSIVRLAYKAMKSGLGFDIGQYTPEAGHLFSAQVEKVTFITCAWRIYVMCM